MELCADLARASRLGLEIELGGPVGERNLYSLGPRGTVLCDAASEEAMIAQIACALAAGNRAALDGAPAARAPRRAAARAARATWFRLRRRIASTPC